MRTQSSATCDQGLGSPGQVGGLLPYSVLGAQVHSLGHVFHGPQLGQQTEVQQGQHQQAGGGGHTQPHTRDGHGEHR